MSSTTVLVAEHDPMQRQVIDLLFSVDGYDLSVVATGAEALAHLRQHTPSAVILATDLPDVSGVTICQKLKAVTRLARVPVVLVAPENEQGMLGETERRDARRAGADLVVQKPLGDKNLRERVQRLMAGVRDGTATPPPATPFTTADLESDGVLRTRSATSSSSGTATTPPATELGGLRAEVARLRDENVQLKARLEKYRRRLKELQELLDEERRRPRGLFGRRS
jgi:CheY-like chemotaxis protein